MEYKEYTLRNNYYTVNVSELGAELVSVKSKEDYEFLWQGDERFWSMRAPLLFPLCGSLENSKYVCFGKEYEMGLHGFAMHSKFSQDTISDTKISLRFNSNEESKKIYPFDFSLLASYELLGDKILFSFTVENMGNTVMPYLFGWHPAFNLPTENGKDIEDYALYFGEIDKLNWRYSFTDGKFFSNRTLDYPLDNGTYRVIEDEIYKNDTMIFTGHKNKALLFCEGEPFSVDMEWSENLETLCIWKEPSADAKFLCIEPWCFLYEDGVLDANYDLRPMPRLKPGEKETYSITLKMKNG